MTAAVENHSSAIKLPRTLKWRKKLFGSTNSDNAGSTSADSKPVSSTLSDLKHDIVVGAEGGPPIPGAEPLPGAKEHDQIQHVAGTGVVVSDPNDATANHDSGQTERALSHRQQGKQREDVKEAESEGEDPTAGVGGLSTGTRRSSVAPGTADEDEDASDNAAAGEATQDEERITFYHRDQPYFWLSNSSDHAVHYDGQRYPTAEHLFQALKFLPHRQDLATKVRKAPSPSEAMREARKNATSVRSGWIRQRNNVNAMRTVLLLKFTQHSALQRQLLKTGDAELIEDSPTDAFWGIASASGAGGVGAGRNELGKALVRTRENLRNHVGLGYGSAAKTV